MFPFLRRSIRVESRCVIDILATLVATDTTGGALGGMNCVVVAVVVAGDDGDFIKGCDVDNGGNGGGAAGAMKFGLEVEASATAVELAEAPLRLMIFSSIRALTDIEAVCKGGPLFSFLSDFLLSESFLK